MPRPYFAADQATVTVLKPVASSAFGSYKLSVPEDVDINDIYQIAAPGNELGYVASLAPKGVRVGGFARRFVRADVSVTAADTTDPDWVPSSDVDKVLTEAAARVEGDFVLESDITKAGLGPWIPFTHFEQGDLATVEIWGRRVPLPVTRIEPKVTDHDENDWSVHVGGQVLTDDEARLAENETLRQAAVQSRREVAGLESQTAKAVSTADSANAKSDQALKAATDADGTIQSKLDEQRRLSSEFSSTVTRAESAAASASDAFRQVDSLVNSPEGAFRQGVASALAAQDDVNKSQQQINATQSNINRQQGEINTALFKATTAATNAAADAVKASQSATTAVNAQEATVNDTNDLARLTHFRRTRVFIYERASDSQSETGVKLPWDDRTTALTFDVDSSGAIFKWDGAWEGYVKVTAMTASSRLGLSVFDVLGFTTGKYELWDKVSSEWIERYVIEIFPLWPDKATKNRFMQRGLTGLK